MDSQNMPAAYAKNRVCIRRTGYACGMHHPMHTVRPRVFGLVPPIPADGMRRYAWYASPLREKA